jgi:pimeloyl-ACP methyl ester carboxylesterase
MLEKVVKTPCVVVGHSLGGMQSYLTSVARPDLIKAVLLEDPPLYMLKKEVFDKTPYKPAFEFLYKDIAAFQASGKTAEQITAEIAQRPLPGSTELTHEVVREDALLAQGKARLLQDVRTWEPTFDGTMGDNDENATSTATGVLLQADMALGAAFFPEHVERFKKAAPGIEVVEIKGVRHQIHDSKAHYDEFMRHLEGVLEKAYP